MRDDQDNEYDEAITDAAWRIKWEFDDALDYLAIAIRATEQLIASESYFGESDKSTRIKEWVSGLAHEALEFRVTRRIGEIEDEYWAVAGGRPLTREEFEAMLELYRGKVTDEEHAVMAKRLRYTEIFDRSHEPERVVRLILLATLTRYHSARLEQESQRILSMHRMAVVHALSPRLQELLARVSRLYILGMDIEVSALARAALEAALTEAMPEDVVRAEAKLSPEVGVSLVARIKAARRIGMLDATGETFALLIRARGNQSLHEGSAPLNASGGPAGIISRLAYCLRQIGESGLRQGAS